MCNRFGPALAGPGRELLDNQQLSLDLEEISRIRRDAPVMPHGWAPGITRADSELRLGAFHWWLVPGWWRKSLSDLPGTFNARAESLSSRPMFRGAWAAGKRCLIPAEYYLEGRKPSVKRITRADGRPLLFAGLWDEWRSPEGEPLRSCTVITCDPNPLIQTIHSRMPVILGPEEWNDWLDPQAPTEELQHLLRPCPDDWLRIESVG